MMPCTEADGDASLTVYDFFFEKRPKGDSSGAARAAAEEGGAGAAAEETARPLWGLYGSDIGL